MAINRSRTAVAVFCGLSLLGGLARPVSADPEAWRPGEAYAGRAAAPPEGAAASTPRLWRPEMQGPVAATREAQRGSLFSEANYQALTSDRRRFKVGDIITVMIAENSSASTSADSGSARDAAVGLSLSTPSRSKQGALNTNNDFNASGRTQRSGRVLGQLSLTVLEVYASGDVFVAGEQLLDINGERQTIRAEGRLRPRDINEQNVALSSRMADARLSFAGKGLFGDAQRPGWWQRLLTLFGL